MSRPPLPIRTDSEQLQKALQPLVDALAVIAENAPRVTAALEKLAASMAEANQQLASVRQAQQTQLRRNR